ncbi:DNA mismatch repair endonuclease MutH [Neiella marina]|uniref:DNA mismatch repair protein MutH n=1 Tax=Neiella holothuriorum TaxID=2870530 RepID=A0ABS7EHE7_9GAMM|nr:DNA mismatch repair endonuclease MutH [Neiella holothuriorum]MBW8191764.1 DNA mismatch repair endonuclease MutH [Neiella holothuriorum]
MQAPESIDQLSARAQAIAGLSLAELADQFDQPVPADFSRHKGWGGMLIELALGATAGSKPEPDFPELGVELKTLPISSTGQPLETTFVCVAPMLDASRQQWHTSSFRKKVAHVLWVPVLADKGMSPAQRQIGSPFLWQLSGEQEQVLKRDWQELTDLLALGQISQINAHFGEYLQLRPKAANGSVRTQAFGEHGELIQTQPKGFYLRTSFTSWILRQQFAPK